jgi:hypothetical protein
MHRPATAKADADTILKRLRARALELERRLEAVLAAGRLPRAALAEAERLAARFAGPRLEEARRAIEAEPVVGGQSWEELSRPSLESIASRGPLLRA